MARSKEEARRLSHPPGTIPPEPATVVRNLRIMGRNVAEALREWVNRKDSIVTVTDYQTTAYTLTWPEVDALTEYIAMLEAGYTPSPSDEGNDDGTHERGDPPG